MGLTYTVIIGDSCIETKKIPSNLVKAVITSPPYNVGKNYKGYSDNLSETNYQILLRDVFTECKRILTDDGLMFINLSDEARNPFRTHEAMRILVSSVGLYPVHRVIWSKPNVQPLAPEKQIGFSHEFIFILAKKEDSPYKFNYYENVDVWEFYEKKEAYFDHPALFPVGLPERCAKLICKEGDTILDPFGGLCNTILAARSLRLNCICIELGIDYLYDIKRNIKYGQSITGGEHFKIIVDGELKDEVFCNNQENMTPEEDKRRLEEEKARKIGMEVYL